MSITRRAVLEALATASDADKQTMTTPAAIAMALNTDEGTVESQLTELEACELARTYPDGRVRITITGEELLLLEADEMVIVDPN